MVIFLIIVVGGWATNEALKHYKAEKYARKVVNNQDIHFLSFMLLYHPLSLLWIIVSIILVIILLIAEII